MLGALVLASGAQDQSPDYPSFTILRLFLDTLTDLLNCLDNVSFLKLSERPVHVSIMSLPVEFLRLATYV